MLFRSSELAMTMPAEQDEGGDVEARLGRVVFAVVDRLSESGQVVPAVPGNPRL